MSGKKTKKTVKSRKIFRAGTEEREIFSLVLNTISKLLDEKKVRIELDSSGDIEFSLNPKEIKDCVSENIKDKLCFEDFMKTISTEIESLVKVSIYSDKAKGIENNIPSTVLKDVGIDEFLWRLEEVEKLINVPESLKQDSIFRKTTKGLTLQGIKWETNNKTFDEELGQLKKCKYATLSIMYSQPDIEERRAIFSGENFRIQLPVSTEPKQITLELQKKDVAKLIDNLQQILDTF